MAHPVAVITSGNSAAGLGRVWQRGQRPVIGPLGRSRPVYKQVGQAVRGGSLTACRHTIARIRRPAMSSPTAATRAQRSDVLMAR